VIRHLTLWDDAGRRCGKRKSCLECHRIILDQYLWLRFFVDLHSSRN